MRTAIIADWLPTFGGAEHVVASLHREFPEAPVFTTVARPERLCSLQHADIRLSRLQRIFRIIGTHTVLLPWMPRAVEGFDLRNFDVILSSSHAVGKGIIPPSTAVHICYCHTPIRYGWEMEELYLQDFHIPEILRKPIRNRLMQIRRWDMTSSKRVDCFIANSRTTQERIKRFYGRESIVIHPPVEEKFLKSPLDTRLPRDRHYFLALGRLVPYKRFDLLVETANTLKLPLKIAGTGHDFRRLKSIAGPTVELLGFVPDHALPELYAGARAFFFPQIEDAGVAALEAQASGTPVIALGQGGALDTVIDGKTGIFFEEQSVDSITKAIDRFSVIAWSPKTIREHAEQFSEEIFRQKIRTVVKENVHRYKRSKKTPKPASIAKTSVGA
ncbi:MAG: group 1 glycosyl transferase [Candidatus Peregrinibacteria bacterium Greene0416_62]|nr:MAG: group 1 glycosyl transferase [Candidatus Peregrinibacteria bacterium Greene0416_62]TSC99927.1 MAG: group 1 glycosyl transferase [Candidatus Peregrinibacteria bacterium Greene1014_49]